MCKPNCCNRNTCVYDDIDCWEDGSLCCMKDRRYSLYNNYELIVPSCDNILKSSYGTILVFQNNRCGLINWKGEILVPCEYFLIYFTSEGTVCLEGPDGEVETTLEELEKEAKE